MRYLLPLLVLGVLSSPANAQQKPRVQVEILVEISGRGQHESACGVDKYKSSIDSIAALTLRNNGIEGTSSAIPILYIQVGATAVQAGRSDEKVGCVISLRVGVREIKRNQPPVGGLRRRDGFASVILCESEDTYLVADSVVSQFTNVLEENIKLCLGDLTY